MLGSTEKSTIVYEYAYNENMGIAEAVSLTSHVPGYILKDAVSLAASSEDNMIFVVASDHREKLLPYYGNGVFKDTFDNDTYDDYVNPKNVERIKNGTPYPNRRILYVYKWAESGNEKIQSAWSKWNYRGSVVQVQAARGMLYMDIDHEYLEDQERTVIGSGEWKMHDGWDHYGMNWNMSRENYIRDIQLQRRLAIQPLRPPFLEATTADYAVVASVLDDDMFISIDYKDFGKYINRSWVDIGEFVFKDRASNRYTSAKSNLKALFIKSDPGSLHNIVIRDLSNGRSREVRPSTNKKFKGVGLAANYYLQNLGRVTIAGRSPDITKPLNDDGIEQWDDGADNIWVDSYNNSWTIEEHIVYGQPSEKKVSFEGKFDIAPMANNSTDNTIIRLDGEHPLPNLYGIDVPVMVNGRSDSSRILISSYYDKGRDYGFRIQDIVQEANIIARHKLS